MKVIIIDLFVLQQPIIKESSSKRPMNEEPSSYKRRKNSLNEKTKLELSPSLFSKKQSGKAPSSSDKRLIDSTSVPDLKMAIQTVSLLS